MKNRLLKVRAGSYDHPLKGVHAYYIPPPVPYILIKGYWLEKINFRIGTAVDVEVTENQLILIVKSE